MNCPRQTVNGTIAASSMATLLQKNCIKTLTVNNGVVMVNATSNGANSVGQPTVQQGVGVVGAMQTGQPLTSATSTSRVLLPHELGSLAVQSQPLHQTFQFQAPHVQQQQQQQQQYIYYNNGTLSNSTTTFVTQNNIPKPSSLGTIQFNSSSGAAATVATTATAMPTVFLDTSTGIVTTAGLLMTNKAASQMPKLNQIIAANNTFASSPASAVNRTIFTTAAATPTIPSIGPLKTNEIRSQSDGGIQRNGTVASITDNNNSNYSPAGHTTTTTTSTSNSTTIQTNDIKHTTSTNNLIGHGSLVGTASKALSSTSSSPSTQQQEPTPPPPPASIADSTVDETNEQENEPEPEIDIVINNVVCSFSVRCHLNLREIALNGRNVEFRRENGMVTMKLRRPYTTASIWSSGRITCTGATSEDQAKIGARRYARCLQTLGFPVRFNNFRVVNVLGTCSMPWAIKIVNFSEKYKQDASYEPELHPGVTYKLKTPKATLKIFSTGSITVTAGSVAHVQMAIEHIFPLVYEFRKKRVPAVTVPEPEPEPPTESDADNLVEMVNDFDATATASTKGINARKSKGVKRKYPFGLAGNDPHEDNMFVSDDDDEEDDDL